MSNTGTSFECGKCDGYVKKTTDPSFAKSVCNKCGEEYYYLIKHPCTGCTEWTPASVCNVEAPTREPGFCVRRTVPIRSGDVYRELLRTRFLKASDV